MTIPLGHALWMWRCPRGGELGRWYPAPGVVLAGVPTPELAAAMAAQAGVSS